MHVGQIPLGGTATGTGLNTHPEFARAVSDKHGDIDVAIIGAGAAGLDRAARRVNGDSGPWGFLR